MPPLPPHIQIQLKKAFDLLNAGRVAEARAMGQAVLKSLPREANALYLLGVIDHQAGNLKEAAHYFEKSHKADRKNPAALSGIGIVRLDQGRFAEAVKVFEQVRKALPKDPALLNNLGVAYKGMTRMDKAIEAFSAALAANPRYGEAYTNLGAALNSVGDFKKAEVVLKDGIRLCPQDESLLLQFAETCISQSDPPRAIETLEKAVRINPASEEARRRLSSLYVNQGNFDRAWKLMSQLVREFPDSPMVLFDAADLAEARPRADMKPAGTYREDGVGAFIRRQDQGENLETRPVLCQRLAHAYEAKKDYARSFYYQKRAQDSYKKQNESVGSFYDRAAGENTYDRLMDWFSERPVEKLKNLTPSRSSTRPVFIVGMPRSGTSLLEQVLASHPAIYGGGELLHLPEMIGKKMKGYSDFADYIHSLTEEGLEELAATYLEALARENSDLQYVTDKLPVNFRNTGLIRLMFPNCLILNTLRHPLDVGWSIYVQQFASNLVYDHDLGDIGHYYAEYDRLMRFWRQRDPDIMTVCYEAGVFDLEGTVMPILDRLRLDWHPDMAKFFETERAVSTASRLQVRRPIYKSSVQRWRNFADHLGPMRQEMGDLPDQYEEEVRAYVDL